MTQPEEYARRKLQDSSDMLTATEVAKMLKISPKTVYRYTAEGKLPYCKFESNVRFAKREILFWIEEHKYRPHSHGRRPERRMQGTSG
jgi:excisionase family DNA binding protein